MTDPQPSPHPGDAPLDRAALQRTTHADLVTLALSQGASLHSERTRRKQAEQTLAEQSGDDRVPWDRNAEQDAPCTCGHDYHRHFDSYEDMDPVGCKYCECRVFQPARQADPQP